MKTITKRCARGAVFLAKRVLLLAVGSAAALAATDDRAQDIDLGRQIYVNGTGAGGRPITALLGEAGTELSAAVLQCVGCHGEDGEGRAEGGVFPSNVTWQDLTRPYEIRTPTGRLHQPYDEPKLVRAITMGLDPAGNPLHVAMPRYRLTHEEAAALVSFLKVLGRLSPPGVDETGIRLGVILPEPGALGSTGERTRAVLEAAMDRLNRRGGVYSRMIELAFATVPAEPGARRLAIERFLEETPVFALLASFMIGAEREIASLLEERRVPLIGPFTPEPEVGLPLNRYVFYLSAGLAEQGRALVDFAVETRAEPGRVVVAYPDLERLRLIAEAVRSQGRKHGSSAWAEIEAVPFAAAFDSQALVRTQKDAGTDVLFFLGSDRDSARLLAAAAAEDWRADVFLLGPLAGQLGSRLETSFEGRVFLSLPTMPLDHSGRKRQSYRELAVDYQLPAPPSPGDLTALTAVVVLHEALQRVGRDLTREKLLATLEELYGYETGFGPPISFGPNRRVGAQGAYVVAFDTRHRSLTAASGWITPR